MIRFKSSLRKFVKVIYDAQSAVQTPHTLSSIKSSDREKYYFICPGECCRRERVTDGILGHS